MSRAVTHRFQRNSRSKQQRNIRVPQGVNRNLRQIGPRDKVVEPTRYAVRMDRRTIILRKQPVAIDPAVPHRNSLSTLPFAKIFQQHKRLFRQFDRAYGGVRLCAFREDPFPRQVLRSTTNRDHIVFEIDVLPFEAAKLSAPYPAEQEESNHHLILVWFVVQQS